MEHTDQTLCGLAADFVASSYTLVTAQRAGTQTGAMAEAMQTSYNTLASALEESGYLAPLDRVAGH